jgi:hypothetical protein
MIISSGREEAERPSRGSGGDGGAWNSNSHEKPVHTFLTDPFFVFGAPFIFAWIYLITPDIDIWFYVFIRQEYWAIVTTTCYAESADVYYPGYPDSYYNAQYLIGVLLPLCLNLIGFAGGLRENFYWNSLVATSPVLSVVFMHGLAEFNGRITAEGSSGNNSSTLVAPTSVDGRNNIELGRFGAGSSASEQHTVRVTTNPLIVKSSSLSSIQAANSSTNIVSSHSSDKEPTNEDHPSKTVTSQHSASVLSSSQLFNLSLLSESPSNNMSISTQDNNNNTPTNGSAIVDHTDNASNWFWFLPRYQFRQRLGFIETRFIRRKKHSPYYHWWLLCVFMLACNLMYIFNMLLAFSFRDISSLTTRTYLFQVFVIVGTLLRTFTKFVGMKIDKDVLPQPVYAMIIGETVGLFLYYMFYRLLFESLKSWAMLFIMQGMHLLSEWFIYIFRASAAYNNMWIFSLLIAPTPALAPVIGSAGNDASNGPTHGADGAKAHANSSFSTNNDSNGNGNGNGTSDHAAINEPYAIGTHIYAPEEHAAATSFQQRHLQFIRRSLAVDFGLRFVAMLCTGLGVSIIIITAMYLPWIHSLLTMSSLSELHTFLEMITVSVTLECLNAYAINIAFTRIYRINIWALTKALFRGEVRMSISIMFVTTSLLCAAIYAFSLS